MYRTGGASVRACLEEDDMIYFDFTATSEFEIILQIEQKENIEYFTGRFMPFKYARANPQKCPRN